jgi:hypothetical protein
MSDGKDSVCLVAHRIPAKAPPTDPDAAVSGIRLLDAKKVVGEKTT